MTTVGLHYAILDEPFGSFQIGDESLVNIIPGSFFLDTKDGCGLTPQRRPLAMSAELGPRSCRRVAIIGVPGRTAPPGDPRPVLDIVSNGSQ